MQPYEPLQGELQIPKIRRCPDRFPVDDWERYVLGLFPKLSRANHRLVHVGHDPSALLFDVVRYHDAAGTDVANGVGDDDGKPSDTSLMTTRQARPISRQAIAETHRVLIRGGQCGENRCHCPIFRLGVYGTCPHIEFALSLLREQHGESISYLSEKRSYSEIMLRYGLKREIVFRPASEVPQNVRKWASRCFDANGVMRFDQLPHLNTLIQRAVDERHEIAVDTDAFEHIAWLQQQQMRRREILAAFSRGTNSPLFDTLLKTPLSSYQREMAINAAIAGRFLLLDMPGFGKRHTAIAVGEILAKIAHVQKVLILTNTSTMHTWFNELRQSTERNVQVIFGSPQRRAEWYTSNAHYKIARYDDLGDDVGNINDRLQPELVILDESHTLKRHGTEIARIVRRLDSEHLLILSGVDPAKIPGPFLSFVDMIDQRRTGILDAFLERHQMFEPDDDRVQYSHMGRVGLTLPNHYRRLETAPHRKSLPPMVEHERFLPISESQAKHHADLQSRLFKIASPWRDAVESYKKAVAAIAQHSATKRQSTQFLGTLMRNAAATPQQETAAATNPNSDAIADETLEPEKATRAPSPVIVPITVLHQLQVLIDEMLRTANDMVLVNPTLSGGHKIETLLNMLHEHFETDHVKAIVFAHTPAMLDLVAEKFGDFDLAFDYAMVDNRMPLRQRKIMVQQFQRDANCRVLFATDGALERLTFNYVPLLLHLDRPWDVDCIRQRHSHVTAGQSTGPLHVYHLISYGTIEHALAKIENRINVLIAADFANDESVVLLGESERQEYFEQIMALLDQIKEPPMTETRC